MLETRRSRRRRRLATALAVAHLLTFAAVACGNEEATAPAVRGRGPLVAPYDAITACDVAVYGGPETALYSDRPYHTQQRVAPAVGRHFCRGARHGTQVWVIAVAEPTTLIAFGTAGFGLEGRGWTRIEAPLRVDAAGTAFDAVYRRDVAAGRWLIRQGFSPAAPIVLWDPASVHPAP